MAPFRSPLIPLHRFLVIARNSAPAGVEIPQLELSGRMALFRRPSVLVSRFDVILLYALARSVFAGQDVSRFSMARFRRLAQPQQRFLRVRCGAGVNSVQDAKLELRIGIALNGRLAKPLDGAALVLSCSLAAQVHVADLGLSTRIALFGPFHILLERLGVVAALVSLSGTVRSGVRRNRSGVAIMPLAGFVLPFFDIRLSRWSSGLDQAAQKNR